MRGHHAGKSGRAIRKGIVFAAKARVKKNGHK
jgi:hypothetical protein